MGNIPVFSMGILYINGTSVGTFTRTFRVCQESSLRIPSSETLERQLERSIEQNAQNKDRSFIRQKAS